MLVSSKQTQPPVILSALRTPPFMSIDAKLSINNQQDHLKFLSRRRLYSSSVSSTLSHLDTLDTNTSNLSLEHLPSLHTTLAKNAFSALLLFTPSHKNTCGQEKLEVGVWCGGKKTARLFSMRFFVTTYIVQCCSIPTSLLEYGLLESDFSLLYYKLDPTSSHKGARQ